MQRRWLGLWIAGSLVVGTVTAGARVRDDGPRTEVSVSGGTATTDAAPRSTSTTAVAEPSSSTATSTPTTAAAAPRRTAPAPAPPAGVAPPLVATTAVVDQPGAYVVRRDGSEVRRVLSGCTGDGFRTWADADELVLTTTWDGPASRVGLDGSSAPWTLPQITDRYGRTGTLRGIGSLSPDGRHTTLSFGGETEWGVAVVDLTAETARGVFWGENPAPSWSPTGEILLVGPGTTALIDDQGTVLRDWAPTPISMGSPWLQWSPDGRRLVSTGASNINSWVILDPHTNGTIAVPQIGIGMNRVAWAGPDHLVLADVGTDHVVKPSLHLWKVGASGTTRIADAAFSPTVPRDGQIVAFDDRNTYRAIGVASLDGKRRADLLRVPSGLFVSPHSWSPDGQWLLVDVCADRRGSTGGLPTT